MFILRLKIPDCILSFVWFFFCHRAQSVRPRFLSWQSQKNERRRQMIVCMLCVFAWQLHHIDTMCAKTTIRLWHELHVARKIPHDFTRVLSPQPRDCYIAISRHEDMRAIAICNRQKPTDIRISTIAHHPDAQDAVVVLIKLLIANKTRTEWRDIRAQPRWFFETLYLAEHDTSF